MRLLVPNPFRWLTTLIVLGGMVTVWAQHAPEGSRSAGVRFVEPESETISTNALKEDSEQSSSLRGLNSSVHKPFSLLHAGDAFGGNVNPQPQHRRALTPAELKRLNELRDRKKNWAFLTPEEIYGVKSSEQIMNVPEFGPDGEPLEPKSAIERFIERMDNARAASSSNQSNDQLPVFANLREGEMDADADDKPVLSFMSTPNKGNLSPGALASPFGAPIINLGSSVDLAGNGNGTFSAVNPVPLQSPLIKESGPATALQDYKKLLESRPPVTPVLDGTLSTTPTMATPPPFALTPPSPAGLARPSFNLPTTLGVAPSLTPAFSPPPDLPTPTTRYAPPSAPFELPKRKF